MISPEERAWLLERAYLPEHLPDYVTAISPVEPALEGEYLYYYGRGRLIFVAYPLTQDPADPSITEETFRNAAETFDAVYKRYNTSEIAVVTPAKFETSLEIDWETPDSYYRLPIPSPRPPKKVRNMLKRARQELTARQCPTFGREHHKLVETFLRRKPLDTPSRQIFKRIPEYLKRAPGARIYEARDRHGRLAALAIADFSAAAYGFYMFNIPGPQAPPGASDLLLAEILHQAECEQKTFANLGLGIHPGITFFKTKWGARAFLPCISGRWNAGQVDVLEGLLDSLYH